MTKKIKHLLFNNKQLIFWIVSLYDWPRYFRSRLS